MGRWWENMAKQARKQPKGILLLNKRAGRTTKWTPSQAEGTGPSLTDRDASDQAACVRPVDLLAPETQPSWHTNHPTLLLKVQQSPLTRHAKK